MARENRSESHDGINSSTNTRVWCCPVEVGLLQHSVCAVCHTRAGGRGTSRARFLDTIDWVVPPACAFGERRTKQILCAPSAGRAHARNARVVHHRRMTARARTPSAASCDLSPRRMHIHARARTYHAHTHASTNTLFTTARAVGSNSSKQQQWQQLATIGVHNNHRRRQKHHRRVRTALSLA